MIQVEGWPALMSTEMATRYLSVEESLFIELINRFKIPAVEVGDSSIRWRRLDLDRLTKQLPSAVGLPAIAQPVRTFRFEEEQVEAIAKAVAQRLEREPAVSGRKLISIKEAGKMLGVGRSSVYRMIEDGRVSTTKIGRRTLVHVDRINSIVGSA